MTNKINNNLLEKEKAQKQNRIWVRISSACNNKCLFCLDSHNIKGTFPNQDNIKDIIEKGYKIGEDNRIILSGGEASINKDFVTYIKYSKEIGYNRIQTVTNGLMFANEEFCKNVFTSGLNEVTFSFHGHNEVIHDYLVNTKGSFKKALKGLIYIKKNFPHIIINVDIVVNKINVRFLPDIIKFFMKLGVYEFDILQIIPFGRGYDENKNTLFYNINDNIEYLHNTWKLSSVPGMYMWTNRFPVEAFEGYEHLIQDPRKIKGEVMGESYDSFSKFIESKGEIKPECFGERCKFCFQKQFCNDFIKSKNDNNISTELLISGEEFLEDIFKKYGNTKEDFLKYLNHINKPINIPICLGGSGIYQDYSDMNPKYTLDDYTKKYIKNLYRKKSLGCKKCKYNETCKGIHINFIRAYSFDILKPIID